MKGLKFLASCAAIGALTTICAVSSYAATATYVDGGTVNVTGCEDYITAVGNNDLTLLVLDGTDVVTVGEANILQINQGDSSILTGIKLDTTKLTAGKTYEVRIGGMEKSTTYANGFISTTFTVPGGDAPVTQVQYIGDMNKNEVLELNDAIEILKNIDGVSYADDIEYYAAAYINGNEALELNDAIMVLKCMDGDYDAAGNAGLYGDFKQDDDEVYRIVGEPREEK